MGTIVKGGHTSSIGVFDIACSSRLRNRYDLSCRSGDGLVMNGYNGDLDGDEDLVAQSI